MRRLILCLLFIIVISGLWCTPSRDKSVSEVEDENRRFGDISITAY